MVYLVVRMKGTVNVPRWADLTLESLHLNKKFRATIIPENEQSLGMLRKIKEWVLTFAAKPDLKAAARRTVVPFTEIGFE